MKIKILIRILILIFVLYLGYTVTAQNLGFGYRDDKPKTTPKTNTEETTPPPDEDGMELFREDSPEMEEEDFFSFDQDYLAGRIHQRKLRPLSSKEKIKWAFRMAQANAFL